MESWKNIKETIKEGLNAKNLSDPSIRIRAIDSIESLLFNFIDEVKSNPSLLVKELDKNRLKQILSLYKTNNKLNSAEESIVNEIYYKME